MEQWHDLMDHLLKTAISSDIGTSSAVLTWTGVTAFKWIAPASIVGFGIALLGAVRAGQDRVRAQAMAPSSPSLARQ